VISQFLEEELRILSGPGTILTNHTIRADRPEYLREVERGGLWFIAQLLHIAVIDDETWLLLEWENPYPNYEGFTLVHREYILEGSATIRPIQSQVFCVIDYKHRPINPVPSGPNLTLKYLKDRPLFTMFLTPSTGRAECTIIHSHGNGSDLGVMMNQYHDLCANVDVNILGYDYTGYGISGTFGTATVDRTLEDILAIWDYATKVLQIPPRQIVLYGQSLGSGPTTFLASKLTKDGVGYGGLILHAPLASGLRVVAPVQETSWFDIYPNIDLIAELEDANIYILQGSDDEVVDVSHGQALAHVATNYTRCRVFHWFPEGGCHNDLEIKFRNEYMERLKRFIKACMRNRNAALGHTGPITTAI